MDADVGLSNIDVLLGVTPKFNLKHVLAGEKTTERNGCDRTARHQHHSGGFRSP